MGQSGVPSGPEVCVCEVWSVLPLQPAMAMKQYGLPITRMLLLDVSPNLGNMTDGNAAAAQRHYLGPALAGPISRAAVPGDCRGQFAARGNDDVRRRRRIHQADVLGRRSEERRVGKEGRSRWSPY